jgi:AcrR family transcriptional regulator
MATRAMLTVRERQDDNHHDHDDGDDPSNLDPAWCGGTLELGGGWRISHISGLLRRVAGLVGRSVYETVCLCQIRVSHSFYTDLMPRLWNETIQEHRREVREAILDTTVALVTEHGLLSVTMSQIAEETGIGRATLYKYFPDVEAILLAWHERQINGHLGYLAEVRDRTGDADEALAAVLEAYALISHESKGHRDTELAALLHRDEQVIVAEKHLRNMIGGLVAEGAKVGAIRSDIQPDELASYCLHAVRRLVEVTLAGLRPVPGH